MVASAVGMIHAVSRADLEHYEGLVKTTARMWARQVQREEPDLEQELRVIVWRAVRSYNREKAKAKAPSRDKYVFNCIANKVKDFKRDAAREVQRLERYEIAFVHIEDIRLPLSDRHDGAEEMFAAMFQRVERDDVYASVDGRLALPPGVTERECNVLLLLSMELTKTEIGLRLGLPRADVEESVLALKAIFADLKPSNSSQPVTGHKKRAAALAEAIAAAA